MQNENVRIALIGSGNVFFKDEGIGLYAVKYLKENYQFTPEVELVDGGVLGFKLMPILQEYSDVVIINTASESEQAGAIQIKSSDEFLEGEQIKKTANEVEIAEMLQICSLTEVMATTTIISMVPEDIVSVDVGLSHSVLAQFDTLIATILSHLSSLNVCFEKKAKPCDLATILHTFANPSVEHQRGF